MTADLIFYALALLTLVPAFWVVNSRNIVHAGFNLLFTLLGVAGLFAWLGADFLAVTQLMVYVGGVLVLVLFTVMMTRVPRAEGSGGGAARYLAPGVLALGVFALLFKVSSGTQWAVVETGEPLPTTAIIGANFMTNYIFPFEYVSLVLLVALIGAAILIREPKGISGDGDSEAGDAEVQS
ncbi:MAG: NADH-quinone oxidoreductase subunit J [Gemmatimonadales bacterium]|nr:NADH-quinone oxidoreductase subunit J [Gemmatimonadales bacterium]